MAMQSEELEKEFLAETYNPCAPNSSLGGRSSQQVSQSIQVISLGSNCSVKMSLRRMGLDQATMPFDWLRTSSAGIIHWVRDGFRDYFQSRFRCHEVIYRDYPFVVYRTETHAFWHDNVADVDTRKKLYRRVQRFCDLDKDQAGRHLLFVRSICGSEEVSQAEDLYDALQKRFGASGRQVFLLIIIDDQGLNGPILHSENPRLYFWVKPMEDGSLDTGGNNNGPYAEAIGFVCRRILGDSGALMPDGSPGYLSVSSSSKVFQLPGVRHTEVGLWCGRVVYKNSRQKIRFCALEGYQEPEVDY